MRYYVLSLKKPSDGLKVDIYSWLKRHSMSSFQCTQHRVILHICKIVPVLLVVKNCLTLKITLLRKRFGSQARNPPPSLHLHCKSQGISLKIQCQTSCYQLSSRAITSARESHGGRHRVQQQSFKSPTSLISSEVISSMRRHCKTVLRHNAHFFHPLYITTVFIKISHTLSSFWAMN